MQLAQKLWKHLKGGQYTGCNRNEHNVIDKREKQILADGADGAAADGYGQGNAGEFSRRQDHVPGFNGHIRACADGKSHISLCQGRGIIDTVPHHSHPPAGAAYLIDFIRFFSGPDIGRNVIHPHLGTDGPGRGCIVTGEHDHPQPFFLQSGNGLLRLRLDHVGDADKPQGMAVFRQHHHGFALVLELPDAAVQRLCHLPVKPAGLAQAQASLYENAIFALTPLKSTTSQARAIALEIVRAIGAAPLWLNPDTHDAYVAATSHMPYLISAALALGTPPEVASLIGPGFRSTARLAGSGPRMMTEILLSNRESVLDALARFEQQLNRLESALSRGDPDALQHALRQVQHHRKVLLDRNQAF